MHPWAAGSSALSRWSATAAESLGGSSGVVSSTARRRRSADGMPRPSASMRDACTSARSPDDRGTQRHSAALSGTQTPAGAIRCRQVSSGIIRCHQYERSLTFPQDHRISHAQRTDGPRLIAAQMDSPQRQFHSEPGGTPAMRAIKRNQRPSEHYAARHAIKRHQKAIKGHQPAITSQQTPSNAPDDHQTQSKAIKGNRRPSEAHPTIARTEVPLAATIEPNGMNDEASPPVASASSWSSSSTSA